MKPIPLLRKDIIAMSVITALSVAVSVISGQGVLQGVIVGLIFTPFAWCGWFMLLGLLNSILGPFKKRGR